MTKDDREKFDRLYGLMEVFVQDKADPKNGWKTERRVFEQKTIDSLATISDKISCLPEMKEEIDLNTAHRMDCAKREWTRPQILTVVGLTLTTVGLIAAHLI